LTPVSPDFRRRFGLRDQERFAQVKAPGQDIPRRDDDLVRTFPFNDAAVRPSPQGLIGESWLNALSDGQDFDMSMG